MNNLTNEDWRNELVTKGAAADAARDVYKRIPAAAITAIKELPPEQPKRIKGKWKRTKANRGYNAEWTCSNCGYTVYAEFCNYHYCSSCGADMRKGEGYGVDR